MFMVIIDKGINNYKGTIIKVNGVDKDSVGLQVDVGLSKRCFVCLV
jgi:hypothetical protein